MVHFICCFFCLFSYYFFSLPLSYFFPWSFLVGVVAGRTALKILIVALYPLRSLRSPPGLASGVLLSGVISNRYLSPTPPVLIYSCFPFPDLSSLILGMKLVLALHQLLSIHLPSLLAMADFFSVTLRGPVSAPYRLPSSETLPHSR